MNSYWKSVLPLAYLDHCMKLSTQSTILFSLKHRELKLYKYSTSTQNKEYYSPKKWLVNDLESVYTLCAWFLCAWHHYLHLKLVTWEQAPQHRDKNHESLRGFLKYWGDNTTGYKSKPVFQQTREDNTLSSWVIIMMVLSCQTKYILPFIAASVYMTLLLSCFMLLWCVYQTHQCSMPLIDLILHFLHRMIDHISRKQLQSCLKIVSEINSWLPNNGTLETNIWKD